MQAVLEKSTKEALRPIAVEPIDKEWGVGVTSMGETLSPFERVNRFRKFTLETTFTVDHERALLVTEAYEKYKSLPQLLKCAKALAHVLQNVTIRIQPDELIVGEMAAPMKSAAIFPEHSYAWILDEIKNHPWKDRLHDNYYITRQSEKKLLDIEGSWKGNTIEEMISSMLTEDQRKGANLERNVYLLNLYMFGGIGHLQANYEKLFALGYSGLKKQVTDKMEALDLSKPDNLRKNEFYQAELIVLDAAGAYLRRYASLAREMAGREKNASMEGGPPENSRQLRMGLGESAADLPRGAAAALHGHHHTSHRNERPFRLPWPL